MQSELEKKSTKIKQENAFDNITTAKKAIAYSSYQQDTGWTEGKIDGELSGTTDGNRICNYRSFLQGARDLSFTLTSPAWGLCTRKMNLQNVQLWKLVKCAQKASHALGPKAATVIWMGPVQPHLLILESLWESQASLAAHTGDMDTGGSHTKELILLQGHWCWCHFGILPLVF